MRQQPPRNHRLPLFVPVAVVNGLQGEFLLKHRFLQKLGGIFVKSRSVRLEDAFHFAHLWLVIVGGEGNGPMAPDAVASGVIIAGSHPAAVDCVAATIMGFDWRQIRMLKGCFEMKQLSFVDFAAADIRVISNKAE